MSFYPLIMQLTRGDSNRLCSSNRVALCLTCGWISASMFAGIVNAVPSSLSTSVPARLNDKVAKDPLPLSW